MIEFFLVLMIKHFIVDLGVQQYIGPSNKQQWLGAGHTHYFQRQVVEETDSVLP